MIPSLFLVAFLVRFANRHGRNVKTRAIGSVVTVLFFYLIISPVMIDRGKIGTAFFLEFLVIGAIVAIWNKEVNAVWNLTVPPPYIQVYDQKFGMVLQPTMTPKVGQRSLQNHRWEHSSVYGPVQVPQQAPIYPQQAPTAASSTAPADSDATVVDPARPQLELYTKDSVGPSD